MDEATEKRVTEKVAAAARAMDEANELVKQALIDDVRAAFPSARKISLELEEDDGQQWYSILQVLDAKDKDLVPDVAHGDGRYDRMMEPLQNVASELFVTPDFCATWVTLEIEEPPFPKIREFVASLEDVGNDPELLEELKAILEGR